MSSKSILKIYNLIKNGDEFYDTCQKLNLTESELMGLLELFKLEGKKIKIENKDGKQIITKSRIYQKTVEQKEYIDDLIHTQICVVSDTHLCSNWQQLTLLNETYKEAADRGIKTVLHVGDLLDGDYHNVRPDHLYQVFQYGFTNQTNYAIDMYPKVEGITTYFITGSHDDTHVKNGGGFVGPRIEEAREDMVFLGPETATFNMNSLKILLKHPGGGSSKYLSYKPQGIVDALDSGSKPQIALIGHFHKSHYMLYRNVHTFSVPCFVDATPFIDRNSISNTIGAYFLDIYSTPDGEIQYICPEEYLFDDKDIIENDYKTCRKLVM